jgi:hypothetical protein
MLIFKKLGFFNEKFGQNLASEKLEKGPRAAKINWRAAVWPCLVYTKN